MDRDPAAATGLEREPAGEEGVLGDHDDLALEEPTRRWPLVAVVLVALAGIAWFGVDAFQASTAPHRSPSEVVAAEPAERFRLAGELAEGSLRRDGQTGTTHFELRDEEATIAVRFDGRAPESLTDGAEVVANGSLAEDGAFEADDVLAECASRFEEELAP